MALSDKIVIMKDGKIAQVGTPHEIYQKPNSAFVAKFIGRANIIEATIKEKYESSTKIEIFNQEYIVNERVKYEKNDKIQVVIRPESIKFNEQKHNFEVVKSLFMGENHEYEVKHGEEIIEIILNNPNGKEIKEVGDVLGFSFDENAIHIL